VVAGSSTKVKPRVYHSMTTGLIVVYSLDKA